MSTRGRKRGVEEEEELHALPSDEEDEEEEYVDGWLKLSSFHQHYSSAN